ncbi:uncharacterized protein LOC124943286 [Impatiens glandulifera]|uniref:uncharacterized protein LOC124943286 n=1 Tax=Impatiens glandulifera TaxID=253017 RepID=UPI001FB18DE6|nr:uncharacterized protein LOC124943286 [Impatiens glandulifera]
MVDPLGPGKFYGSSLPRPRFYTDVKFNDERVDPPPPLLDPFTSWSNEAHWSMGGRSFNRLRLQGRIEGNVKRLRTEREDFQMKKSQLADSSSPIGDSSLPSDPISNKRRRRRFMIEEDDDDDEEEEDIDQIHDEKLDDKFDHLEKKSVRVTRSSSSSPATTTRSSSRLAKRG